MRKLKLPQAVSLAIWLILVPALLFSLGLWQAERAAETLAQSQGSSEGLKTTLAQRQQPLPT